jgi:hypothetical protein
MAIGVGTGPETWAKFLWMSGLRFVAKAEIPDPSARSFELVAQKTMYGGKKIAVGDVVYLIASENEGGTGLVARGIVVDAKPVPRKREVARQTPRVSVTVLRNAIARRRLGRAELKPFSNWSDGRPESEINFKLYRQATDKIVGISESAAEFLDEFF